MSKSKPKGDDLFGAIPETPEFSAFPREIMDRARPSIPDTPEVSGDRPVTPARVEAPEQPEAPRPEAQPEQARALPSPESSTASSRTSPAPARRRLRARAVRPRTEQARKRLKPLLLGILLFLVGGLIGMAQFTDWDRIWTGVLTRLNESTRARVSWSGLDGGFRTTVIRDLSLSTDKSELHVPLVRIRAGLFPFLRITPMTGASDLNVDLTGMSTVKADGEVDLAVLLPSAGLDGKLQIRGELNFESLGKPPVAGHFTVLIPELVLPSKFTFHGIRLECVLDKEELTITSYTMEKPLRVETTGTIMLNWRNPPTSRYSIQGVVIQGDTEQDIKLNGPLQDFLDLAGGDLSKLFNYKDM